MTITNDLGLHARAAAQLVKGLSGFQSRVFLKRIDLDRSADARSILGLLTLAAVKGTVIEVVVEGTDETAALNAVSSLVEAGFGESNSSSAL
jgi:phosphotransferase system HPr (HPr) family protein